MSCSCTNTLTKNYWIIHTTGGFQVTQPRTGGQVVTSCSGMLSINLTTHDCVRLVFTHQPSNPASPTIQPISVSGNCPCEVANSTGSPPVTYEARFKPPAGSSCTYLWTLVPEQPPCQITIVVSKS